MAEKKQAGITIAGRKIPYTVLLLGGGGALALFILTRSGSGGGTVGVPVFGSGTGQNITTEVPVEPDLTDVNQQLADLYKQYQDLLDSINTGKKNQPQLYKIQSGDTLQSIAQKFGIRGYDILHFNSWLNRGKFNSGGYVNRYIYIPQPGTA